MAIRRWLPLLLLIFMVGCVHTGKPRVLTVYTYASFPAPLIKDIQEKFKAEHRATVVFKTFGDTGPLYNRLLQEKKRPKADLVIGLDNNYTFRAKEAGLFQAYRPKAAGRIRKEYIFDSKFYLTPYDYGYIVFNYDSEAVAEIPRSHQDLLKPSYKDHIVVENPQTSSPGQVFLLTTIALFGEDGYLDYWRGLKKNGLFVAPGWDEAYGMFTNGERSVVLSYGASPVYHLLYDKTERYKALVLDNAAYAQIEGMGVVRGAKERALAQELVEYILSKEFQEKLPENQFMMPVAKDAQLPASFRVAAKAKRLLNLSPETVDKNLERWLAAWEKTMNE